MRPSLHPRPTPGSCLAVLLLVGLTGGQARARSLWPQPALGESASGDPEVLFTFDDGPHELHTGRILDTLRAHRIQAIFFVAGWRVTGTGKNADARRALLRRIVAERHAVGNHTMRHAHLCAGKPATAEWELDEAQRTLVALSGRDVTYFRTPYGSRCKRLETQLAARGLAHLHWDMDAHEWLHQSSEATRRYLKYKLSRLEGRAVILLHDTQGPTAQALPDILDWLRAENRRRAEQGRRQIRVLSYADIQRERLSPGVARMLDRAAGDAAALAPSVARRLVGPIAGLSRAASAARFDPASPAR